VWEEDWFSVTEQWRDSGAWWVEVERTSEGQGTAPTIYFISAHRHEVIEFDGSLDRLK